MDYVRIRGRANKTWGKIAGKDCETQQLNKEDTIDCNKYRKLIKDIK